MMHGSNASVSATGSPGSAALSKHNHLSSRPKSASGSSAGTIKRAGSLSSQGTSVRNSVLPMGSQSPGDTSLIALRIGAGTSRRRRSSALDPVENPTGEGMGNLNRWSQSTDASAHSPVARRKRASSIATLSGPASQPMSPKPRPIPPPRKPAGSPTAAALARSTTSSHQCPSNQLAAAAAAAATTFPHAIPRRRRLPLPPRLRFCLPSVRYRLAATEYAL